MNNNEYTELLSKIDNIALQQSVLLAKLDKHIDFVNDTYEGLRNYYGIPPTVNKRKWFETFCTGINYLHLNMDTLGV